MAEASPPARECDCPPWVLRCAHFDGRFVVLGDVSLLSPRHRAAWESTGAQFMLSPIHLEQTPSPCPCCGQLVFGKKLRALRSYVSAVKNYENWFRELPLAIAAFHEAEKQLLESAAL